MKFPFSNISPERCTTDELGPLRELRSPLSTSAIRERVLERAAAPPLWGQLKNMLAECLVVGVAGAALLKIAGPMELHYASQTIHPSDRTHWTAWTNGTNDVARSHSARANRIIPNEAPVYAMALNNSPFVLSKSTFRTEPIALRNTVDHLNPILDTRYSPSTTISPIWFASASGGAIFSHIRMMGERGELGFEDGWKTVALSYASGDGSRDLRDIIAHHLSSTTPILSKERDQEFSLLFGARAQAGPIELRAMAGPAYLSHSSIYFNLLTGTTGAPVSLQGFGVGTEISACYQSTNSFGIGISCTANYLPRQFTSAIFATLEYRFGS